MQPWLRFPSKVDQQRRQHECIHNLRDTLMLRRNFLRWFSTSFLPFFLPQFARARTAGLEESETSLLLEVAAVVLPSSFGRTWSDEIGTQFLRWTQGYKAGADAGYGYGFPHPQALPANPATAYADQLRQLDTAATAKGGPFAKLNAGAKREIIAEALAQSKVDRIPPRPNGRHVATDLLAFFYNSADGQDFLYDVAIKRDDCRGLSTSTQRPQSLS
jgi:hypothetical protein